MRVTRNGEFKSIILSEEDTARMKVIIVDAVDSDGNDNEYHKHSLNAQQELQRIAINAFHEGIKEGQKHE